MTEYDRLVFENNALQQQLLECQAREAKLRDAVLAVLCDPDSEPCFSGSDGDRKVIAEALALPSDDSALQEAIKQAVENEASNPWKHAIIDELINDCILSKEHEGNPRKALQDVITWNCRVALDPSVSSDAANLVNRTRHEALLGAAENVNARAAMYLRRMAEEIK